jgi:hypothetical protein
MATREDDGGTGKDGLLARNVTPWKRRIDLLTPGSYDNDTSEKLPKLSEQQRSNADVTRLRASAASGSARRPGQQQTRQQEFLGIVRR